MTEPTKENVEKARVLRKLMKKWLTTQETEKKANLLLEKNPELKLRKLASVRKSY
ncbi:MAG TPA: hypothetical protein VGN00_23700 [Puia sp.]|jgi:hypothetical protein